MGSPNQSGNVATNPRPDHVARKPRLWLWIAAIAILGVAMLVVILGTLPLRDAARLETALDEIRQSGEPATAAELEAFYAALPADEDPTQLWLDGSAALVLPPFVNASKDLPIVGDASKAPPPGTPWAELEAAEKLLQQNQKSLALLHQAAVRGGAGRYPSRFAQGLTMPLKHLQNLRSAARLLALEAHVRAHRGDAAGAAQAIETLLAVGRSLENEPLLMSLQVRMAIDQLARQQLAELLPHVRFADEDLLRLQGRLEQIEYQSGLRRGLMGERVISQQALQDLGTPAFLFRAGAQQVHLDYMQQLLEASRISVSASAGRSPARPNRSSTRLEMPPRPWESRSTCWLPWRDKRCRFILRRWAAFVPATMPRSRRSRWSAIPASMASCRPT